MRLPPVSFFLLLLGTVAAQDKVILTDGSVIRGKVREVTPGQLILKTASGTTAVPRTSAVLLEFGNGAVEFYNEPANTTVHGESSPGPTGRAADMLARNLVSFNALALCNADGAVFFERLFAKRKLGIGVFGAVNFNRYATLNNVFVNILSNGKKTHDIGGFFNYYPFELKQRTNIYFGAMVKYMGFTYSRFAEDSLSGNPGGLLVTYTPARGNQLAWLLSMGTHTEIGKHVFLRTIAAAGAARVESQHRQQLRLMTSRRGDDVPFDLSVLPKIYLGVNFGVVF